MAAMKGRRRLEDITEPPQPDPQAVQDAKAKGATLVAWDPELIERFIVGEITLGELEGIPKKAQYEYAEIGYRYLQQGNRQRAEKIFRGLSALDPYDAYFHTALGVIAQQEQDLDAAVAHYSRALEIHPRSPVARANRGEVLLQKGQLAKAVEDLTLAGQCDPKYEYESTRRARVLAKAVQEQLEKAKR